MSYKEREVFENCLYYAIEIDNVTAATEIINFLKHTVIVKIKIWYELLSDIAIKNQFEMI